jgi:hypothetical protein
MCCISDPKSLGLPAPLDGVYALGLEEPGWPEDNPERLPEPELSLWAWGPEVVNDADTDQHINDFDVDWTVMPDSSAIYEFAHDEFAHNEFAPNGSPYDVPVYNVPPYDVFAHNGDPNPNILDDWFPVG